MRYNPEQYDKAFAAQSSKIQEFLDSPELSDTLINIYYQFNIPADKQPLISEEVSYTLIGLEPLTKIIDNIKQYAGLDEGTALRITKELEKEVFIPFEDLNLPATKEQAPEREVAMRKIITPNPILNRQLEVPVVSNTPATKPATPVRTDVSPGGSPAPVAEKREVPSILEARMGGSFNMPKEEVKVPPPAPQVPTNLPTGTPAEQKKYSGKDPYREPIE